MAERILIIEDDTTIRVTLKDVLQKQGYRVDLAEDGRSGLELFGRSSYELVLLDLHLPDLHGLEVLKALRESDPEAMVLIMTAFPEVRTAVNCVKAGAYDYLNKPFELDDLKDAVRRAMETCRLKLEVERLRISAVSPASLEGMIGGGPAYRALVDMTRRIAAAARVPVLIHGESGTGKERVAQAIHRLSSRAAGPWVTLNCSALSEGLLESEMFGHEKGAFTDAKNAKRGLLELADGGTLFLDEIGDLSLTLQPKLLRAIETQTFRRVGGQKELQVDVRFVAATNRDLARMVKLGTFREDLYYRLNVGSIEMPPLRARTEDIAQLSRHFLAAAARTMKQPVATLDRSCCQLLEQYAWPGNVRELRNVLERALILSAGGTITPTHLPKEISVAARQSTPASDDTSASLAEIEKRHIRRVLTAQRGNKTRAAKDLGISRLTLRTKITDYGWAEFINQADDDVEPRNLS